LAAQISVQKSFLDVNYNNNININGFINILRQSGEHGVKRLVYASSCSVYGNAINLPINEEVRTDPLSPYASSKLMNELLGKNLSHLYQDMNIVGLRFFNLFGPWQDPKGDYAAVIPKWIDLCLKDQRPVIFGDGSATRDFCSIQNVTQVIQNILKEDSQDLSGVYNIGSGCETSLNLLYDCIVSSLQNKGIKISFSSPNYEPWREGDILHSCASIKLASDHLNFDPKINIEQGINLLLETQYGV